MLHRIFVLLATLVALSSSASAQANCSQELQDALAPCRCREGRVEIYCSQEGIDLQAVLDRASPLVDDDFIFDSLQVIYQSMRELPANLTHLKFRSIVFHSNDELRYIHPDAFPGTYDVTTILDLRGNLLVATESNHQLFTFLNKFKQVEDIALSNNYIKVIPDDPFEELPKLRTLSLGACWLDRVGARIFAKLPALSMAHFQYCNISLEILSPDTFQGIGSQVVLDLEFNPFSRLPQEIFEPVMEGAALLQLGGRECDWPWCGYNTLDCDDVSKWLCPKEAVYRPKLQGFRCRTIVDIWGWCHLQNKNSSI